MLIETPRLILREFTADDLPAMITFFSDPDVGRYIGGQWSTEEAQKYLQGIMAGQTQQTRHTWELSVALRSTGEVIGSAELVVTNAAHREAEIGYMLARAHWGFGYATEAARALVAFGFDSMGLHRIWATCEPANLGSAHVLEKCGMIREGHLRANRLHKDGAWRDRFLYAVLEDEYRAACGEPQA